MRVIKDLGETMGFAAHLAVLMLTFLVVFGAGLALIGLAIYYIW